MISLLISCGKWIISFNLPFKGKKDCVIKESVANKTDRHLSTSILRQFYNKMWFGAPNYLYNFDLKNVILALNNYLMLP